MCISIGVAAVFDSNIPSIMRTLLVSHALKFCLNAPIEANMNPMSVTWRTSQRDISWLNELAEWNMYRMLVTALVFHIPIFSLK